MRFDLVYPTVVQLGRRGNRLLENAVKNAIGSQAMVKYFTGKKGASEEELFEAGVQYGILECQVLILAQRYPVRHGGRASHNPNLWMENVLQSAGLGDLFRPKSRRERSRARAMATILDFARTLARLSEEGR